MINFEAPIKHLSIIKDENGIRLTKSINVKNEEFYDVGYDVNEDLRVRIVSPTLKEALKEFKKAQRRLGK